MALKTFVKVSGINNLSDARYCAGMEVNQLGFNIEEGNSNYTDSEKFAEISEWLSGVEYVGEIENKQEVDQSILSNYRLDAIQVSSPKLVSDAAKSGLPVILKIDIAMLTEELLSSLKDQVSYFLVESFHQGELSPEFLAMTTNYPIVTAFGVSAETINYHIDNSNLKGIALQGGTEIRPGLKDFDEMADILEAIEIDDTL